MQKQKRESLAMVHRRRFFHVPGFDLDDPAAQFCRFAREVPRFSVTWNVKAQVAAANGADGLLLDVATRSAT